MIPTIRVRLLSRMVRQPCSQRWALESDGLVPSPAYHSVMGRLVPCPLGASVSSAAR